MKNSDDFATAVSQLQISYVPCCCSGVPKSAPRRFLPTPSFRNQTKDGREGRSEDAISVAKPGQMVIDLGIDSKPPSPWGRANCFL